MANAIQIIIGVRDNASRSLKGIGKSLNVVGAIARKALIPLIALGTALIGTVKIFGDFESAFAGVRKTVEATAEEFKILEQGIRNMAKEIPATTTAIAGVAEAAGQLGIQKESILEFTRTMIDLGETTNIEARTAATQLARLANITQLSQDQFSNLGSAIVALGNNFATTEAEITELTLRIAGAGAQIGLTEAEMLGFATALSSVGIRAEAGGTAIQRVFVEIASAAELGGEKLQNFSDIAGVSTDEFKKNFEEDAADAVIQFVEGLDRISKSGESVFAALEDVGFANVRVRDTLLRAAGAGNLLRESIKVGTEAFKDNTALTEEAAKRYETLNSKFKVMVNRIKDAAIELGETLAPAFIRTFEVVGDFADKLVLVFRKFPEIVALTLDTINKLFVENFAMSFAAIIDIFGRLGVNLLQRWGEILIEIGAITLKVGAAIFSPLAVAFDIVGQNIKFGWQILVNNLAEIMVKTALAIADKLNVILPEAWEFDTTGLQGILQGIEEEILDIPKTFGEQWEITGKDVEVILGTIGENGKNLKNIFLESIGDIRAGFSEFADVPEIQIFLERLDEMLSEATGKVAKFSETSNEKIKDGIANPDTLAEAKEIWETWFGDWLSAGQETFGAFQEISKATFETFQQGVGDAFANAIVFGQDLADAFRNLMKQIAAQVISALIQIGVQRVAQAVLAQVLGIKEATSRMAILSAETFAGAFAATAAIPIIGPLIAPGVAAASQAAMLAGAVAAGAAGGSTGAGIAGAAAGGLENVPADSTFFLHRGERVVAPKQNKDLTEFMKGGGNGGARVINIGKVEFFPGANLSETLLEAPAVLFRKFGEKMLEQLNEFGDEGRRTTLKQRKTNI